MESIDGLAEEDCKMSLTSNRLKINNEDDNECSEKFMSLLREEKQTLQILGRSSRDFKTRMEFEDTFWRMQNKVRELAVQTGSFLYTLGIYKSLIRPTIKNIYAFSTRPKRVRMERLYKLKDEEFVKEIYRIFFDREADAEGLKHNLKLLQNNQCNRSDMIDTFVSADEAAWTPVEIIRKNTEREKGSFWCGFHTYKNVIMPGFKKVYLLFHPPRRKVRIDRLYKLKDEDFVKELYRVFLNRKPDAEGYRHHLNLLQTNQCDRPTLINAFNNSVEGAQISVEIIGDLLPEKRK